MEERFERLEAQVAGLAEDSRASRQLEHHITGLETNVGKFNNALEHFLGQIRIDDGLRLVPDRRSVGPPDPLFDTVIPSTSASIVEMPHGARTDSEAEAGPEPMSLDNDMEGVDRQIIMSPVEGTVTTPSDHYEDDNMAMRIPPQVPIPPEPSRPDPDSEMPPPPLPPPIVLTPATPQQSQEATPAGKATPEPGETTGQTLRPRARARAQARSRTPLDMVPIASTSQLKPPATRSRSRSKTPL